MDAQMVTVESNAPFYFSCRKDRDCFGACCRNLNHFLTPYDILEMKIALNLSSTEFLDRYSVRYPGPRSGLPVISLRFDRHPEAVCPFLTPSGCDIYAARPTACRLYPLARAVSRNRKTGSASEYFALIRESFCQGFHGGREWTPERWIQDQGAERHLEMNDRLLELIALKNRILPGPLPQALRHFFILALYDLDRFRVEAAAGRLRGYITEQESGDAAALDDPNLLAMGHRWVARLFEGCNKKDRPHED